MSQHPDERKKDVICPCSGTTRAQILRLVGRGVCDLQAISEATGACSGCGGCDADVVEFLAGLEQPARPPETPEVSV